MYSAERQRIVWRCIRNIVEQAGAANSLPRMRFLQAVVMLALEQLGMRKG